jgi:Sap, sulfolipid-1-addressing protein
LSGWIDAELALTAIAAMLSPTTLSFSVLALVVGERPFRTGSFFYLGVLVATLAIGVVAAFVLSNTAASHTSTPKTWVAIVDLVAGALLLAWVVRTRHRPLDPAKKESMVNQMDKVAASPAVAVIGAGAILANPGAFIPIALKEISETDPTSTQYVVDWVFFSVVSLLPLLVALVMLVVDRDRTESLLARVRDWLLDQAKTVAAVIVVLLALALIRNGIAGLVS